LKGAEKENKNEDIWPIFEIRKQFSNWNLSFAAPYKKANR
jgi:hypothetical protein